MEQWKTINGFENYLISNHGNVKSLISNKLLKLQKSRYNYAMVRLANNTNEYKTKLVHRLVIEHFGPQQPNEDFSDVRHINGNVRDNNIENLEWYPRQYPYIQEKNKLLSVQLKRRLVKRYSEYLKRVIPSDELNSQNYDVNLYNQIFERETAKMI